MVITKKIGLKSDGNCDIIDIMPQVERQVAEAEVNSVQSLYLSPAQLLESPPLNMSPV